MNCLKMVAIYSPWMFQHKRLFAQWSLTQTHTSTIDLIWHFKQLAIEHTFNLFLIPPAKKKNEVKEITKKRFRTKENSYAKYTYTFEWREKEYDWAREQEMKILNK